MHKTPGIEFEALFTALSYVWYNLSESIDEKMFVSSYTKHQCSIQNRKWCLGYIKC